ncbi:hypothetical protein HRbin15_02668 [bacterium HR15]|nr:hypothetical protein HRbin15_02668 [bacterium HR15]
MKNWLIATVIACALTLTASAMAQTNAKGKKPAIACPVSGETIKNPSNSTRYTYKGKTYYFCCKDCLAKFKASPATYLNRKPAKANTQPQQASKACCGSERGSCCCSGEKGEHAAGKSCCSEKKDASKGSEQTAEGDKKQGTEQQPATNAKLFCPVSDEEITPDESIAFEYNGKRYYVCCSKCKQKFLADPETYAKKAEQRSPLQGKPVEKESR